MNLPPKSEKCELNQHGCEMEHGAGTDCPSPASTEGLDRLIDLEFGADNVWTPHVKSLVKFRMKEARSQLKADILRVVEESKAGKFHKECLDGLHEMCESCLTYGYGNKKLSDLSQKIKEL